MNHKTIEWKTEEWEESRHHQTVINEVPYDKNDPLIQRWEIQHTQI